MYQFAGRTGDEDHEVDRIENVYHVLEGLMPKRGEYDEIEHNVYEVPVI